MNIRSWVKRWLVREPILSPVWRNMGYRPGPAILSQEAYKKVGYVYRCVRVLMDNAQQVPAFAAEIDPATGRATRLPDLEPLAQLLKTPNHEDDFHGIIESIVQNLNLHGEGFVELEDRDSVAGTPPPLDTPMEKLAPPVRIWSHPTQWLAKVDVDRGWYTAFHLRARGYNRVVPGTNGILFKFLHPDDPWRGMAPLSACYQAADTYYAANLFNARYFENGALPSLHIGFDKDSKLDSLKQEQRERIREEIHRLHSGMDNAHGVLVTGPGETVQELGSVKDMYFESLMKFAMSEILAVFGVPTLLMGNVDNANRANSADQLRMFWTDTMIPMIEDIASLFNRKLARRYGPNKVIIFDYSQVAALQKGLKDVMDAAVPGVAAGIITINEVRTEQLNKGPVAWGDEWWHDAKLISSANEGVGADNTPVNQSVRPETARRLLKEWKNAAIGRVRAGARTPIAAFPAGREAQRASSKYGIPNKAAFELAKLAFHEMALSWDVGNVQNSIADFFDRHIEAIQGNSHGDVKSLAMEN